MPCGMADIIPWRRRVPMPNSARAAEVAPTDGEFRMLLEMLKQLETNQSQRFGALDDRLDRQDAWVMKNREVFEAGLEKTNAAVAELRNDVASAKGGVALGRWIAGLLGIGGFVAVWRWFVGPHS
jgi:hypothetical protein